MTTSFDVACQLVELAGREPESEPLTHLRVQKIVYYCQGWSLALLGRPLFNDRIEAWKNGPVAVELYQRLKRHATETLTEAVAGPAPALSEIERQLIAAVWREFRDYSASGLYRRTHAEPTWLNARGDLPEEANCSTEITHAALKEFFSRELDDQAIDGLTPRQTWDGYRDVIEGLVSSKTDTFARLRSQACASS